jgi:hypothetical protein
MIFIGPGVFGLNGTFVANFLKLVSEGLVLAVEFCFDFVMGNDPLLVCELLEDDGLLEHGRDHTHLTLDCL